MQDGKPFHTFLLLVVEPFTLKLLVPWEPTSTPK